MSAADEALVYAITYGWPVFPISAPEKIPFIKEWCYAASTNPSQIKYWWRKFPSAAIATPTGARSRIVVLDIDVKRPDQNGFDTLAGLGLAVLPDTPMAHTKSGGLHVYFARHPTVEIRNSQGELGPGLDVRGEGGLVVLPCTISGYSWDPNLNPFSVKFLTAPFWLGHRKREKRYRPSGRFDPPAALREACERIRCAKDGAKHYVLNREAFRIGTLVAGGLLRDEESWADLQAAAAVLIATSDAERARTEKYLAIAFSDGLNAPRRRTR